MNFANLIGQVVDGKYQIERQLGKGGMGTVYLATHLGTERPVAVKVIVQQFMQRAEFVERFRREARAAGRLRHPNVVDVTDFGIAEMPSGKVAYLVMEYLDGCTLGEILEEEKHLPLSFSLDILEQVCSAVQTAHELGIIHRDLKPDNIWLEPNQRGGYTVKVLDFGIAKLEEPHTDEDHDGEIHISSASTQVMGFVNTVSDASNAETIADKRNSTMISEKGTLIVKSEAGTLIQQKEESFSEKGTAIMNSNEVDLEDVTAIFPDKKTQIIEKEDGTRLIETADKTDENDRRDLATAELTKVGAVLGTPLYMSPEQCRGEKLTPRSDIYSLGVIAYQMLGGKTPFEGEFTSVMQAHKEIEPPRLEAKKVPKKVKKVVHSALAKNTDERPQTAEAFASILRSHSEGIGALFRKALTIYGEHLPKFLLLSFLLAIPFFITNLTKILVDLLAATDVFEESLSLTIAQVVLSFADFFVKMFYSTLLVGATTWIVAQILATPLRPIQLRSALNELKKKWKPLLKTVTVSTLISLVGFVFCFFPGIFLSARYMLIAPSIMMEDLSGRAAFRRSIELVKRAFWTVVGTALIVYLIPTVLAFVMSFAIQGTIKGFSPNDPPAEVQKNDDGQNKEPNLSISVGNQDVKISDKNESAEDKAKKKAMKKRVSIGTGIFELLWMPVIFVILSFTSIITALLYFKTRQAGGELMMDLLETFEDSGGTKTNWQQRVEQRLIQSGRITSKP
jgi:serine/threonine protein kinase